MCVKPILVHNNVLQICISRGKPKSMCLSYPNIDRYNAQNWIQNKYLTGITQFFYVCRLTTVTESSINVTVN